MDSPNPIETSETNRWGILRKLSSPTLFWCLWGLLTVVVVGTVVVNRYASRQQIIEAEIKESLASQKLAGQLAQQFVSTSEITLQTIRAELARHSAFAVMGQGSEPITHDGEGSYVNQLLADTISIDNKLSQLRIINDTGQEIARVDRLYDNILITPPSELQDKSSRPYVRDALDAAPGTLMASPVTLNEEFGRVQEPETPVSRYTLTVDEAGRRWILVLNVRFAAYEQALLEAVDTPYQGELWLVRPDGIFSVGGERYASIIFSDQKAPTPIGLKEVEPRLWSSAQSYLEGGFVEGDYLYVHSGVSHPALSQRATNDAPLAAPIIVSVLPVGAILSAGGFSDLAFYGVGAGALLLMLVLGSAVWAAIHSREQLLKERVKQDKIFSVVAHELRTPASAIDMMIRGDALKAVEQKELESASSHLLNVIDDLRQVMHPLDSLEFQQRNFTFGDLRLEIERQMSPLCSSGNVSFNLASSDNDGVIYRGDVYRLRVIITNLVRNAVLHSQGSAIWLSVSERDISPGRDEVSITVEDNGVGIPANQVAHMFEMFSRGGSTAGGTGVGLAIVKQWTEGMGGEVSYAPSQYGGAKFTIVVPLDRGFAEAAPTVMTDSAVSDSLNDCSVLLVEDDRILRTLTKRKLEEYGCNVICASDGEEAIEILTERRVQLVLTDYFMPKVSGKEVIQHIRRSDTALPVIALTAATIGSEADDLRQVGADIILSKPFGKEQFEAAVAKLIREGRFGGQPPV